MEAISVVLPVIVLLVLIWLLFLNVSYAVIIFKARKQDSSLVLCLNKGGRYFYISLIIVYVIVLVISTILMIREVFGEERTLLLVILNTITIISIGFSFLLQQIIFVGHRQILIGKVMFDYRKIKRIAFPKATKIQFVYGQKKYQTSLWFIDDFKLKKALQKAR